VALVAERLYLPHGEEEPDADNEEGRGRQADGDGTHGVETADDEDRERGAGGEDGQGESRGLGGVSRFEGRVRNQTAKESAGWRSARRSR